MSAAPQQQWANRVLWFWSGMIIFAAIGFASFWAGAFVDEVGLGPLTLGLIVVTALPALLLMRRNIPMASGILGGYAIATALSAGQCTYWSESQDYGFLGGAIYYLFALGAVLVLALVVAVVETTWRRR